MVVNYTTTDIEFHGKNIKRPKKKTKTRKKTENFNKIG